MDMYQTEIVVGGLLVLIALGYAFFRCVKSDSDD
jgi:hypothetical protein